MDYFQYRRKDLFCEGVSLRSLAEEFGTPLYVYSRGTIVRHYRRLAQSWNPYPATIAYAMKANSGLAILDLMRRLGSWVDTVSGGEIYRALRAGFPPERIIFGGVGKSREELAYAIRRKVAMIVADGDEEISLLGELARRARRRVTLAVRVNPGVDPLTHDYIATGLAGSKFGVPASRALGTFRFAASLPFIDVAGIHQHIGSQIVDLKPYLESLRWLAGLVAGIRKLGIDLRFMDIGGGIGIRYKDERPFELDNFSKEIIPIIRGCGCRLILEPGRVIVGNAGVLVARVLYVKSSGSKRFVIVDAAMNDLIRPALYDAYHAIRPVRKGGGRMVADVVGPVCESGDFLARDRSIQRAAPGDLIAVMSAGAYGFSMASNYNSRTRAAEVLVSGRRRWLVRKRESREDLVRGERIAGPP